MIIIDETREEEESDTDRKEGHEKRTDGTKTGGEMGQDGQRRKKYTAAVTSDRWHQEKVEDFCGRLHS